MEMLEWISIYMNVSVIPLYLVISFLITPSGSLTSMSQHMSCVYIITFCGFFPSVWLLCASRQACDCDDSWLSHGAPPVPVPAVEKQQQEHRAVRAELQGCAVRKMGELETSVSDRKTAQIGLFIQLDSYVKKIHICIKPGKMLAM